MSISQQDLIDAAEDLGTIETVVNSDAATTVTSRLGQPIKTLRKAIQTVGFKAEIVAWAPSTAYSDFQQLISESDVTYRLVKPHTSTATFADDLAAGNWAPVALSLVDISDAGVSTASGADETVTGSLNKRVITEETEATMVANMALSAGVTVVTLGQATAGDGLGQTFKIVTSDGDVTLANGNEALIVSKHKTSSGVQTGQAALDDRVVRVGSVAEMEALSPAAGYQVSLSGEHNGLFEFSTSDLSAAKANDPNKMRIVPPASDPTGETGAWVMQSGNISASTTVDIPTQFASHQAAFNALSSITCSPGAEIIINTETGHLLTTGWRVSDGDYGRFRLTSADAEVGIDPVSFTGADASDVANFGSNAILVAVNARSFILDMLINGANSPLTDSLGYVIGNSSNADVLAGAGVKNTKRNLEVRGACTLVALNTIWTGATGVFGVDPWYDGIRITQGCHATVAGADASGSAHNGLDVSRSSVCYANEVTTDNCAGNGIDFRRSMGSVQDASSQNCTGFGLSVDAGSPNVFAQGINLTGSGGLLVNNGSTCAAKSAILTGTGASCSNGSTLHLESASLTTISGRAITGAGSSTVNALNATISMNAGDDAVRMTDGSRCNARGVGVTRLGVAGDAYSIGGGSLINLRDNTGDTSVNRVVNSLTGQGIIFSE